MSNLLVILFYPHNCYWNSFLRLLFQAPRCHFCFNFPETFLLSWYFSCSKVYNDFFFPKIFNTIPQPLRAFYNVTQLHLYFSWSLDMLVPQRPGGPINMPLPPCFCGALLLRSFADTNASHLSRPIQCPWCFPRHAKAHCFPSLN